MALPFRRGRVFADADPEQPDPTPGADQAHGASAKIDWLQGSDKALIAQQMTQMWVNYSKLPEVGEREARWTANELRRDGYTGVRLIRAEGGGSRAWVPMNVSTQELSNEGRRLSRVFVGNLMADPPAPQVFPVDTGSDDRDTSDVSERALGDLQSERRLNTPTRVRDALDTACTYGSGYIVYQVDQTGGGRVLRTMMASPLAPTTEAPLIDPATGFPYIEMEPVPIDPMEMAHKPGMQPPMRPKVDELGQPLPAPSPIERMVHKNEKQFTDDPQEAAYDWVKDLKSEVLSGRHVRLIPHTAENVWEAHGVMIATFQPWKTLKSMFPELAKLSDNAKEKLAGFRPAGSDKLLPKHRRSNQQFDENAVVFTLVVCYEECGEYPDGFYGIAVGNMMVPYRAPWVSFANQKREALLLPVSQVKLFRNGKSDPDGSGIMDDVGPMGEVMAAQIGHLLHYLDWFNNPTVYVPLHSTIQDADILARKPIIRILPGGEPKSLTPPPYPRESMAVYELMRDGAQNMAHLMEAAQGVDDPSVKSGRHAYQIVAQAHAQLSEPKQNIERGYIRCCEIELQYSRAFGLSGDAKWTGDDGEYKVKKWQGADLAGDVRIKPGTMTMLSPAAKAQLVEQWMLGGILTPEEGREMLTAGIGAVVGLRDDPFKLEIRRSISVWEEGPPEGWVPFDPMMALSEQAAQQGTDPMTMQAAVQAGMAQMPVDPMAEELWAPRSHHSLPGVAQIRVTELAKLMASRRYHAMERPWQALVDMEFERMTMAAAPPAPMVDEEGKPIEGQGGEPAKPSGGQGFSAQSSGMPAMDNPALTGGDPGQAAGNRI
jgi:hypothetical protein